MFKILFQIIDVFMTAFGWYFIGYALGLLFVIATVWCGLGAVFAIALAIVA